jgi:hypothetical protein
MYVQILKIISVMNLIMLLNTHTLHSLQVPFFTVIFHKINCTKTMILLIFYITYI